MNQRMIGFALLGVGAFLAWRWIEAQREQAAGAAWLRNRSERLQGAGLWSPYVIVN